MVKKSVGKKKLIVIGAGQMGRGISLTSIMNGYHCVLVDENATALLSAKKFIYSYLIKKSENANKANTFFDKIVFKPTLNLTEEAFLIIEAIHEDLTAKRQLLQKLSREIPPSTVIGTNTSSFSITLLAHSLEFKERFLGVHFFNPPHVMSLVEIIPHEKTNKKTINLIKNFCNRLRKEPVLSKNSPGFIVNRLLFPMINEAIYALQDGVADKEDIDKAMRLGANLPIGPLHLADLIGLDVCLSILETLFKETGKEKYFPPSLLVEQVKKGNLGRKTKKGFFKYENI